MERKVITLSNIAAVNEVRKTGNQLFEHGGYSTGEEYKKIWEAYGYSVVSYTQDVWINDNDVIIFSDRENFYRAWNVLKERELLHRTICVMIESEVVDRKCGKRILNKIKEAFPVFMTYQDDLVDNSKFFKYCPSINSRTVMEKRAIPYGEMGLAAIVCTNQLYKQEPGELYSERRKIIQYFEKHREYTFGLFGRYWDGFLNWGGVCKSKSDIYGKYKFAICLENSRVDGYITEKIFDCFQKGIVPVYGGAYNVTKYIPQECFIDYFSFRDLDELVSFLNNMDEGMYNSYLIAIQKFLKSDQFEYFRLEKQIDRIYGAISHLPGQFTPGILANLNMFIFIHGYEVVQNWVKMLLQGGVFIKKKMLTLIKKKDI